MAAKPPNTPASHGLDVDRTFDVVIEQDEDGWFVASVPALPGCHTQGKSVPQARERIKEAILLCLASGDVPSETARFVGVERVTVEA